MEQQVAWQLNELTATTIRRYK